MALVFYDRVQQTGTANTTVSFTLSATTTGYQSFSVVGNGNTTYYSANDGTNWEVGIGTYATGGTLTRTTILSSSNSGSAVTFTGTVTVFCDYPAGKAVIQDATSIVNVPTLSANSSTSVTPSLTFNASNSSFASGATIANNYLQAVIQNKSGTSSASTNYVLSNDLGTDSTYYGEFGMNSSVYSSGTPGDFFSLNNGIYFSGHDGDLSVGSGNGYKTYFGWGTAGQSAHVINASGALGFSTNLGTTPALSGTTGFGTSGQLMQSNGSAAAPSYTSSPSVSGTVTGAQIVASNGIFVNSKTVAASYSIPSGSNASSTGPVTVASGQSVTVPSGSRWVVL